MPAYMWNREVAGQRVSLVRALSSQLPHRYGPIGHFQLQRGNCQPEFPRMHLNERLYTPINHLLFPMLAAGVVWPMIGKTSKGPSLPLLTCSLSSDCSPMCCCFTSFNSMLLRVSRVSGEPGGINVYNCLISTIALKKAGGTDRKITQTYKRALKPPVALFLSINILYNTENVII